MSETIDHSLDHDGASKSASVSSLRWPNLILTASDKEKWDWKNTADENIMKINYEVCHVKIYCWLGNLKINEGRHVKN